MQEKVCSLVLAKILQELSAYYCQPGNRVYSYKRFYESTIRSLFNISYRTYMRDIRKKLPETNSLNLVHDVIEQYMVSRVFQRIDRFHFKRDELYVFSEMRTNDYPPSMWLYGRYYGTQSGAVVVGDLSRADGIILQQEGPLPVGYVYVRLASRQELADFMERQRNLSRTRVRAVEDMVLMERRCG